MGCSASSIQVRILKSPKRLLGLQNQGPSILVSLVISFIIMSQNSKYSPLVDMVLMERSFSVVMSAVLYWNPLENWRYCPLQQVLSNEVSPFGVCNYKQIFHRWRPLSYMLIFCHVKLKIWCRFPLLCLLPLVPGIPNHWKNILPWYLCDLCTHPGPCWTMGVLPVVRPSISMCIRFSLHMHFPIS